MVDKICEFLVQKIINKMPEIDDERAEVIKYGIQIIIGEVPKIFVLFAISFLLGIGWYTVFLFIALLPYRAMSGGFHLKTHIGCIVGTSIFYLGNVFLSKIIVLNYTQKISITIIALIFGIIMISLYAPADTENVPILSTKERRNKKVGSYITLIITLAAGFIIKDNVISNILIFGAIIQTLLITKLAYRITNNKYGFEVYKQELETIK